MSETVRPISDEMLRRLENADAPQLFDELLEMAADACLAKPLQIEAPRTRNTEAEVVSQLGVRGLRAAIDLSLGFAIQMPERDGISIDTPMKFPEQFSDATDQEVMAKITAFGEGLLAEAYRCLGKEADEKVCQYAAADSDEEQIAILEWMHVRLEELTDENIPGAGVESFYHPARLSPKLIGVYPDTKLAPTCLGLSIIASSFLERAGADHLHAGVMQTYEEFQAKEAALFLTTLPRTVAELYGLTLPSSYAEALRGRAVKLMEGAHQDRGYHAVSLAKLKSGKWLQLDPNFNASALLAGNSGSFDKALEYLTDLKEIAPGLETTVLSRVGTLSDVARMMMETGHQSQIADAAAIREILLDPSRESVTQRLKECVVDPFFEAPREVEFLNQLWSDYSGMRLGWDESEPGGNGFYSVLDKYIFDGQSIEEFLDKCQKDERYLERRIEDIQALPLMVLGWYSLDGLRISGSHVPDHVILEAGLPAHRIGAAVLNDFASYCDDRLTPSFRLSHWSSHVPITETVPGANRSEVQKEVVKSNARWLRMGLRYNKDYDIVNKLLEPQE